MRNIVLPPEWYEQSAIQLTWPHHKTDWNCILDQAVTCFVTIAKEIAEIQVLIIVCEDRLIVKKCLGSNFPYENVKFVEIPSNDTWARDHSAISVFIDNKPVIYDFTFNGWGLKFSSNYDNLINRELYSKNIFNKEVRYKNLKNFVLEGGSFETDGKGTILTTSECLLSPNRNSHMSKGEIEKYLKDLFGLNRILWLDYGYLAGDDTDSHIDTLARFCNEHTIAYVKCTDTSDEHYDDLLKMEQQLQSFVDFEGRPYKLIPLPMAEKICINGERLPATYANFLITNQKILLPVYNTETDKIAVKQLKTAFPDKQIAEIDCSVLIMQHGSLHCVTMQYPAGFIKNREA